MGEKLVMSLDVTLKVLKLTPVFEYNITHNLNKMAEEASIYEHLWHPERLNITKAFQLIPALREGLTKLKADPDKYKRLNPANGWGDYEGLVKFVSCYLEACIDNPDATVEVDA
jgi:hypothetical protein